MNEILRQAYLNDENHFNRLYFGLGWLDWEIQNIFPHKLTEIAFFFPFFLNLQNDLQEPSVSA